MEYPNGPQTWDQWFREGTIYETEFFHGLIACSKNMPVEDVLAVLRGEEHDRFVEMLKKLVALEDILAGQTVTSVARYEVADARKVLEAIEK